MFPNPGSTIEKKHSKRLRRGVCSFSWSNGYVRRFYVSGSKGKPRNVVRLYGRQTLKQANASYFVETYPLNATEVAALKIDIASHFIPFLKLY
jgi:hypothetical protein